MAAPPWCLGWLLFRLDLLLLWREPGRRWEVLVEGLQWTLHPLKRLEAPSLGAEHGPYSDLNRRRGPR